MREPQGSREDSAPDAHLINFLPDPNAGIGGMIYVYADYFFMKTCSMISLTRSGTMVRWSVR